MDNFEIRGEYVVVLGTPIRVSIGAKMMSASLEWCESFQVMLSAMYQSPTHYRHMADLMMVSMLARLYDVNPIVFESINKSICQSSILLNKIDEDMRIEVLLRATSFPRYATLFREAIVYAVAYWPMNGSRSDPYPLLKATSPNIYRTMFLSRTRVNQLRAKVDHEILVITKIHRCLYDVIRKVGRNFAHDPNAMHGACYYQALLQEFSRLSFASKAFRFRNKLLRNDLRFDTAKKVHGLSPHSHLFLCAEVTDEELPWNETCNIGASGPEPTAPVELLRRIEASFFSICTATIPWPQLIESSLSVYIMAGPGFSSKPLETRVSLGLFM